MRKDEGMEAQAPQLRERHEGVRSLNPKPQTPSPKPWFRAPLPLRSSRGVGRRRDGALQRHDEAIDLRLVGSLLGGLRCFRLFPTEFTRLRAFLFPAPPPPSRGSKTAARSAESATWAKPGVSPRQATDTSAASRIKRRAADLSVLVPSP